MQDAKRRAVLFLVLAMVLATIAGFMFLNMVSAVDASLGDYITVYVATKDIKAREPLNPEMFEAKEIPAKFVNQAIVTDLEQIAIENTNLPLNALVSVVPIEEGGILTKNMLKSKSNLTDSEKRMVLLTQSDRVGFDDVFSYNDRVDILYTEQKGEQIITKIFKQGVPVIGVGSNKGTVTTIGLELTLEEAKEFIRIQYSAPAIRVLKAPNANTKSSSTGPQTLPSKEKSKDGEKQDGLTKEDLPADAIVDDNEEFQP